MPEQSGQTRDIAELSHQGYQLLRDGSYDDAVERFESVLELEPGNSYALVGLGDIARKRGKHHDAVGYYQRCIEHDPDNAFALFGLADSYRSLRKYHEALAIWERYLAHDDENVTVLTRVADAYRKVRRKRRSHELYERVLELEPDNPYALVGLGHLHYDFREYEEALSSWQRMHELAGTSVDIRVLTSIGNCYRKLRRYRAGIPFFEEALEREPDNFYALFGLADCYRGLNDPAQSLVYWKRILEKDPQNRVILTRAGDAHRTMGELDEAEECYRAALAIGDDLYANLGLAIAARMRGDREAAIEMLNELKRREPDNHRVYVELAATHARAGSPEDAIRVLAEYQAGGRTNAHVDELIERYRAQS